MNRAVELYNNLMALVASNEAFYFQDFESLGRKYRIFNYRLASYTDFLAPDALEARGVMFEVSATDPSYSRLVAWPQQKFFNMNENPMVMNLDMSQIDYIEVKADGSLMSTYIHHDMFAVLRLKSKGSISSEQAVAAMEWLDRPENEEFHYRLHQFTIRGYTVNLEWCAPQHRIVIGYPKAHLKVLNARNINTGEMVSRDMLTSWFRNDELIERVNADDKVAFVQNIKQMSDIEGFIVGFKNGLCVKVKCDWYLSLHHAKDSVNNPRRLFEAILDEGIDDLRSLFFEDVVAMQMIDEMQKKVDHIYNGMVKMVEDFYAENKDLDRKSYAIKGQEHFKGTFYFGLAMNKYVGKTNDYKTFLKGKWKELGLKDTSIQE